MSSVYTGNLTVSIFGQSHAPAIGVTVDGLPAGLPVDPDELQRFLSRRAPGQNAWSTPRREADAPEFLCGLKNGKTCGAPLTAIIRNTNTRSGDYENLKDIPRPGHADYTAQVKFGGAQDVSGGGHFSGRLTAPLCIAGGVCMQLLEREGISIRARILSIGHAMDSALSKLLHISDTQLSYITNAEAGHGLLRMGGSIVPFVNTIPRQTELYKLMTTTPGESR